MPEAAEAAARPDAGLTSLARLGVESGGTLTERTNDSNLALSTALNRLSCFYSLGFRDDDFHDGRRKSFDVILRTRGLHAFHPEAYVLRSEAMKRESRLLAAFVDPAAADDGSLRALIVPRGGDGTTWKTAVQLRLRPDGLEDRSAELGASIVRHNAVADHFASSIATKSGSRAIVLEKSVDLRPGDFSIVAVANDAKNGHIGSSRVDHHWPDPAAAAAAITPIAVLQSGPVAMSRDGEISSAGVIAKGVDETLDPSIDISLASVVCRGAHTKGPVRIERWLDGGAHARFEAITIADAAEPCMRAFDVVPSGRLAPGDVEYHVVARVGGEVVAEERRTLRVGASP